MTTAFASPANNFGTRVAATHAIGSGTIQLSPGAVAALEAKTGTITATNWVRFTALTAGAIDPLGNVTDESQLTIFKATGTSGDSLTGLLAIENTSDREYLEDDIIEVWVTDGSLRDIQQAVNAVETILTGMSYAGGTTTIARDTGAPGIPTVWFANTQGSAGLTLVGQFDGGANADGSGGLLAFRTGAGGDMFHAGWVQRSGVNGFEILTSSNVQLFRTTAAGTKVGSGAASGDSNSGLDVSFNTNTIIYSLGSGLPSLKAMNTSAGGAITKIQAGASQGIMGTESNHKVDIRTNNIARITIDTTGRVMVGATLAGALSARFEVTSPDASTPIAALYDYLLNRQVVVTAAGSVCFGNTIPSATGRVVIVEDNAIVNGVIQRLNISAGQEVGGWSWFTAAQAYELARVCVETGPGFIDQGNLVFKTRPGGGVLTERARIGQDGTTEFKVTTTKFGTTGTLQLIDTGGTNFRIVGIGVTALDQALFQVRKPDGTGTVAAFNTNSGLISLTAPVYVGAGAAGSLAAEFEVTGPNSSTPIMALYDYLLNAQFRVAATGAVQIGTGTGGFGQGLDACLGVDSVVAAVGSNNPQLVANSTTLGINTILQSLGSAGIGRVGTASNHPFVVYTNNAGCLTFNVDQTASFNKYVTAPAFRVPRLGVNAARTHTATDPTFVAINGASGPFTITLPAANAVPSGYIINFKDEAAVTGANAVTIAPAGADTIPEGPLTLNANYASLRIYSDGVSKWFKHP